jgi:Tol biopolymer transport system component
VSAVARRIAAVPLAALVGAGCGAGLTRDLIAPDAGPSDVGDSGPDPTPPPPPMCNSNTRFGAPVLVPGLNDAPSSTNNARFSPDELTAYIGMYNAGSLDLFVATRTSRSDRFGTPTILANINTPDALDDGGSVTADGLTLYFESNRSAYFNVFMATRTDKAADFSPPIELKQLHVGGEGGPYVIPDGSALYFHSLRSGNYDIYRVPVTASGLGTPEAISLDTALDEWVPVVSPDELTIYFRRDTGDGSPMGIWMATRAAVADAWGPPIRLPELDTPYPVLDPMWISPDGCRIYLEDVDSSGGYWSYVAERLQ